MRLDHTAVVVRERTTGETLDLALRLLGSVGGPFLFYFFLGALPFIALNTFLLGGEAFAGLERYGPQRYLALMTVLVYLGSALAGSLAVLYMGRMLFFERTDAGTLYRFLRQSIPQLAWRHGVLRGLIPGYIAIWLGMESDDMSSMTVALFWIMLFAVLVRMFRPYISEVILLERNPWVARKKGEITTSRRSRELHRGASDVAGGLAIGAGVANGVVLFCCWFGIQFLVGTATNHWGVDGWLFLIGWQAALWLTAAYSTMVRFLGYLDLRMRREGWEVELLFRAEADRLAGGLQ